jgi:hypothetical protein
MINLFNRIKLSAKEAKAIINVKINHLKTLKNIHNDFKNY